MTDWRWDVTNADPDWARLYTEYQPDPEAPGHFRRLHQKQYMSMTSDNEKYVRFWDYGDGQEWQYSIQLFDRNGRRYAHNYKMDDDTWRTYDYDQNGRDWARIKQYLLADARTCWQKETLFDNDHFVIQKWDVGDRNDAWDYYYIELAGEGDSEEDAIWKWYVDDNGVRHYEIGDANGTIMDRSAPPYAMPGEGPAALPFSNMALHALVPEARIH